MGAHIPVDGGDVFWGEPFGEEGGGGGCFWTLDRCVLFVLFLYVDVGGPFFFCWGGGILLEGKGEWVMLLDNGCVVPSFVVFV